MISASRFPAAVLRLVQPEDEAFLFALFASTRAEALACSGLDTQQQESLFKLQFRTRNTAYNTNFPDATHSLVLLDSMPAGALRVNRAQDEIRVVDIALLPAFRGQGLGSQLLQALINEAAEKRIPVRLHVLKESRAIVLYERLNFTCIDTNCVFTAMEWNVQAP